MDNFSHLGDFFLRELGLVKLLVIMAAGICLYSGWIHLFLSRRLGWDRAQLSFAFAAIMMGAYDLISAAMYRSADPAVHLALFKAQYIFSCLAGVGILWLIHYLGGLRPNFLIRFITAFFILLGAANLIAPHTILYESVSGIRIIDLALGERMAVLVARDRHLYFITEIMSVVSAAYLFYGAHRIYRQNKAYGVQIMAAVAANVLAAIHGDLVDAGVIHSFYLFEFSFLFLAAIMSRQLADRALEAGRVKRKLDRSESDYRLLVETLNEGVLEVDQECIIRFANPRMARLVGLPPEKMIGRHMFDFLDPEDLEAADVCIGHNRRGERGTLEARLHHVDGSIVHVIIEPAPLFNPDGTYRGSIAGVMDVTGLKRMDRDRLDQASFVESIISNVAEGIVVYDRDQRYVLWNQYMEERTGVPRSRVMGKRPTELFPFAREQSLDLVLQRVLEGEVIRDLEVSYKIPETGRRGWVLNTYCPHYNSRGEIIGVIGIMRDVTEHRRLAAEARRDVELLDRIQSLGQGAPPPTGPVDLDELLDECSGFALAGSEVNSLFHCQPGLWTVAADRSELYQALYHLFIYRRAALAGGGELKVQAENARLRPGEVKSLEAGPYVVIILRDPAAGLSPQVIERLDRPGPGDSSIAGSGIASALTIIRRHGGLLRAETTPEQGSLLKIFLPAGPESRPVAP